MATNTVIEGRSKPSSKRKTTLRQKATTPGRSIDRSKSSISPLIYLIRLVILGFGLSTIIGTTISIVKPPKQQNAPKTEKVKSARSIDHVLLIG